MMDQRFAQLAERSRRVVSVAVEAVIDTEAHDGTTEETMAIATGTLQAAAVTIIAMKHSSVPAPAMRDSFLALAAAAFDVAAFASGEVSPSTGGRA